MYTTFYTIYSGESKGASLCYSDRTAPLQTREGRCSTWDIHVCGVRIRGKMGEAVTFSSIFLFTKQRETVDQLPSFHRLFRTVREETRKWNTGLALACRTHAWPCAYPTTSIKYRLLSSFSPRSLWYCPSHSALDREGSWRKMEAQTWRSRSCFCISMRRSISCPARSYVTSSSESPTASLSPSPWLLACRVPAPPPPSSSPPALQRLQPVPSPWDLAGTVLVLKRK